MVYPDGLENIKQGVVEELRARSGLICQMNPLSVYLYSMIYLIGGPAQ
ncbi:hypothetical protein Slin_4679 [Spirosoma linguale DSM 74]|uniref:Uncharacterized protein n=1 Tax=Spirosoma linguale (strain ATCC 33905 / DSM 74 / LMG 10896 / Claus 1) TaxID=504472 RepID=D2QPJ8_SPILD|nr:hypothetical protein Slin_4679 [Spirosoma linguale DSM 74]